MERVSLFVSICLAAVATNNCSTFQSVRVNKQQPQKALEVLAVLPVQLLYKTKRSEGALRTSDVLQILWNETTWPILPPSNFTVLSYHVDDPIRRTDAILRLGITKESPQLIGVLNTSVSYREARGRAIISAENRRATGVAHELQVVVSMSLVGAQGKSLFELETVRAVDPFAERPDYDDRPEIASALRDSVIELLDHVLDWIEPGPEFLFRGQATLAALDILATKNSNAETTAKADPIQTQLRNWHIAQYFRPELDFDEVEALENLPAAVCLDSEFLVEPFVEGDCILTAADEPIYDLHYLRLMFHERTETSSLTLQIQGKDGIVRSEVLLAP